MNNIFKVTPPRTRVFRELVYNLKHQLKVSGETKKTISVSHQDALFITHAITDPDSIFHDLKFKEVLETLVHIGMQTAIYQNDVITQNAKNIVDNPMSGSFQNEFYDKELSEPEKQDQLKDMGISDNEF